VDVAWWADVASVVAGLHERLGVAGTVLRLLTVTGGEGARDGHVTYHVEAAEPPARDLEPTDVTYAELAAPQRFRAPWATAEGLREVLGWATGRLAAAGRPVTGPAEQHRTWNLAGLFRLPTATGPVWLKATPHFATDEAAALTAIARHDPALVPAVIDGGPGRVLLEHVPGDHCRDAPDDVIADVLHRFARVQAALAAAPPEVPQLPDRRDIAARARVLLDDGLPELTVRERAAARRLTGRWHELAACGLPDTLVHGDFHPVNWHGDPPVVIDLADAHLGNPVLDGLRAADFLPETARPAAARAWVRAWAGLVPGCDPARALAVAEPLAHLAYAVRYQEFLDGIEPSERVYHDGDPAAAVREALRLAAAPSPWAVA
jgi:phosphotransferase family enzyme